MASEFTACWERWRWGRFPDDLDGRMRNARAARHWSSRFLHSVGAASSHSAAGIIVAGAMMAWVVFGVFVSFPTWWENALYISSSIITLIMVFAIQHTQSRQQAATQRKLDELLLSQPRANDRLVAVEEAPDGELERLTIQNIADRERAIKNDPPSISEDARPTRDPRNGSRPR